MKLKLDEHLPSELVDDLHRAGHDVETVLDEGLGGASDPTILAIAKRERRVLLTLDKGIGNIGTYPPTEYAGIILFRPASAGRRAAYELVTTRLPMVASMDLDGRLVVVTERSIRKR